MKSFFKKVFTGLFGWIKSGKAEEHVTKAVDKIIAMEPVARPIVARIAEMTPGRTDDELNAAFWEFGLPGAQAFLALPQEKRGLALLDLAATVLRRTFPNVETSLIHQAIEGALFGLRKGIASEAEAPDAR